MDCPFCAIAAGSREAVIVYEDSELVAFLDHSPVRPGHTQVIPRIHVDTFELLPRNLAHAIMDLGQELAMRMKEVYAVDRVAFLYTGGDVAHAHAHVIPIHEKGDITSARYLASAPVLEWSAEHLRVDRATLLRVREQLGFRGGGG